MEFLSYMISLPALGIAAIVTIGNIVRILAVHNKNNVETASTNYVSNENFEVLDKDEKHIRTYETKRKVSGSK